MMMMYVVFAPLLVALAAGSFLFAWSQKKESGFGKLMGMFITLLALILLVMQGIQTSKMWREGRVIKKEMREMMKQMPEVSPKQAPSK